VHYSMSEMAQVRVLAGARASLLRQGVTGLQSAPCLRALLLALPTLLQEQYQYEKPLVVSGEQLLHSGYLKCLAALVLVLQLDKVLCYKPVAPNHDEYCSVGKLPDNDNCSNICCQLPACALNFTRTMIPITETLI
jgi:hypothetical protein